MERYRANGAVLTAPPASGVDENGHAITNFAVRIAHDAAFAERNGYYPRGKDVPRELSPATDGTLDTRFILVDGEWQITLEN